MEVLIFQNFTGNTRFLQLCFIKSLYSDVTRKISPRLDLSKEIKLNGGEKTYLEKVYS